MPLRTWVIRGGPIQDSVALDEAVLTSHGGRPPRHGDALGRRGLAPDGLGGQAGRCGGEGGREGVRVCMGQRRGWAADDRG